MTIVSASPLSILHAAGAAEAGTLLLTAGRSAAEDGALLDALLPEGVVDEAAWAALQWRCGRSGLREAWNSIRDARTWFGSSREAAIHLLARLHPSPLAAPAGIGGIPPTPGSTPSRRAPDKKYRLAPPLAPPEVRRSGAAPRSGRGVIAGNELTALVHTGLAKISPQLLSIPGGQFRMGDNDLPFPDAKPAHPVRLAPFRMSRDVITNDLYQRWVEALGEKRFFLVTTDVQTGWPVVRAMGEYGEFEPTGTLHRWEAKPFDPMPLFDLPKQPVCVDWRSAYLFAYMHGTRLATEAEWEWAATQGGQKRFATASGELTAGEAHVSIGETLHRATAEVDDPRYLAGSFGLRQMAGNVGEWVMDWHDPNYYAKSPEWNPTGPVFGDLKGVRSGSWHYSDADYHHASVRGAARPEGDKRYAIRLVLP